VRKISDYTFRGEEPKPVLALTIEEFKARFDLRSDAAIEKQLGRLQRAGVFRPAGDRLCEWVVRRPGDKRGPGRDRMLLFIASDNIQLRRELHAAKYDEREARRSPRFGSLNA
jgi:hypothetical protein